jgi:hypothetical protein
MQKFTYPSFTENLMSSVATGNVMTSSSCQWTTRHYSSPSKFVGYCPCFFEFLSMPVLALVRTQGAESVPVLACGKR